jgi:DNA-binding response OmpR family regulator
MFPVIFTKQKLTPSLRVNLLLTKSANFDSHPPFRLSEKLHRIMSLPAPDRVSAKQRLRALAITSDRGEMETLNWIVDHLPGYDLSLSLAADSLEAATLVGSETFDLAIGDFWFGQDTIVSLIYGLREIDSRLPFLVLTNIDTRDIRDIGMRAGAVALLSKKELSPATLNQTIDDLLLGSEMNPIEALPVAADEILDLARTLEDALSDLEQIHCATVLAERFIAKKSDAKARDALADAISRAYSLRTLLGEKLSAAKELKPLGSGAA